MINPAWEALPAQTRDHVDELVLKNLRIHAIKEIRDAAPAPVPGIHECLDMIVERYAALGQRFDRGPSAPLELETLAAEVRALPGRPAAVEAVWDGDTEGWFVRLLVVMDEPGGDHCLAIVSHGGDLRLFEGTVAPWPEAREASTVGPALAERFGVPFHFASPDVPDDSAPRWRDLR
ncbi:hypothetical protein [Kitasatospora herbaricolor]|uniref:Histidine phosphatase family protein n=1 Tax=Kitasatospora herbaricolor TaxID=68217 RepID=A0ABZ1WDJ1_9ACTN|nr:hypothetical protein [Kitasatospora herbaricolor]